ncbi:Aldo-keto reductase [Mycena kentingensis (nom. inval.)]|nr:Aldo-keto reductase [Mycena kentingensis (nom. inval.)]
MYPGQRVVKLPNSSTSCPIIGLGAWAPNVGEERTTRAREWITSALKMGYRHIDTAWVYGTEKAVGEAIKEAGVDREDVFVVSKLPSHHHGRVAESIQESLDNLGFKWLDMYLMHWPIPMSSPEASATALDTPTFVETWQAMENVLRHSKCEAIGVSNFSIKNLEELMKHARTKPAMNQVEMHPYLAQNDLLAFCNKNHIAVVAYTPTGKDTVRSDPVIVSLAEKYQVTSAQIILAWHLSRGVIVIPRSANEVHQKENFNLPTLEPKDLKQIDALDRGERICNKPDNDGMVMGMPAERLGW